MTIIYYIRHGKTDYNNLKLIQGRIDMPLNEEGISDTFNNALMYKDAGLKFDKIYSSPLKRAYESAKIFKEVFKYDGEIEVLDDLTERFFGEAENTPITEEVYVRSLTDDYKDIEPNAIVDKRMYDATVKIGKENEGKRVLVVSHSYSIKRLLCVIDNDRIHDRALKNASITTISYEFGKLDIVGMNETPMEGSKWKI